MTSHSKSTKKVTPRAAVKAKPKAVVKAAPKAVVKAAPKAAVKAAPKAELRAAPKATPKVAAKPAASAAKPVPAKAPVAVTAFTATRTPVASPPIVKAKAMPKKQLQHLEKRLLEERRRVLKELGNHDETFDGGDSGQNAYSFHMADQGTDAMEREKAFLFASQEGRFLWHIDQALRRLYRSPDTFGVCHGCGQMIAFERLDALPHARYCINCKQKEEDDKQKKG